MSSIKWSRRTTEKVADQLKQLCIKVSASTVCRLLKSTGFPLKSNRKSIAHANSAERNEQFEYIAHLRESYAGQGQPIISVNTRKIELVGTFKNPGRRWEQEPTVVNDHDFRSLADGMAVPYGIYELQLNRGNVYVGTNADTPQFTAESIARWWKSAQRDYAGAQRLLILADGGESNGVRCRAWKAFIQTRLADRYRIPVTVCHYPPGTSKWNPIEHRLFSEISKN